MVLSLTTFHARSLRGPVTKRASPGQLRSDLHSCAGREELLSEDSLSLLVPGETQLKKGRMKLAGYRSQLISLSSPTDSIHFPIKEDYITVKARNHHSF